MDNPYTDEPLTAYVKQGDTWGGTFTMVDDTTKEPVTGVADKLISQILDRYNRVISECTITESVDTPGTYILRSVEPTIDWSLAGIHTDIRYRYVDVDGVENSTASRPTLDICMEKGVSQWPTT